MKLYKVISITIACVGLIILSACQNPDDQQMKPASVSANGAGNGMDLSNGGAGGINGINSAFSNDANSLLPGRPQTPWTPIPGVTMSPIHFAFDSSVITSENYPYIEKVVQYMNANPSCGVIVQGNCDERGSAEYNLGLGERRALAAQTYLTDRGIPATRIQTISYGSEHPVNPAHNETAWAENRRDDFVPATMNQ